MSRGDGEEFTFVCPECDESLAVNESMMEAIIRKGCVICGSEVTTEAFTSSSASERS